MLRAFSWVVLGNLARQASFLLVNVVVFDRLSRSTFGAISLAFGYMTVFAGLGDFGIRQIAWREVARRPEKVTELSGPFLSAKILVSLAVMLLFVLVMPLLWAEGLPASIYLLYGLGIVLNGGTFDFPLFGRNRLELFAKLSAITYSVYLLACILLVTRDERAWLVPAIFVGSMCLLLVLELRWFGTEHGRVRLRFRPSETGRILRQSWPLGVGETLNRLALTYPLFLIGVFVGSEGVGNYRIAELGYSFLAQFGHMYASAGFSRLSHSFQHRSPELPSALGRMSRRTIAAGLLVGGLFALAGPPAFQVLFGGIPSETAQTLRVLGFALMVSAPARFLRGLLPSIDRQDAVVMVNAVGILVGVSVGWLSMASHGIVGMAFGVAAAELTALVVLVGVYRKGLRRFLTS